MTEREKLIKQLNEFGFDDTLNCCIEVNDIVNFILEDRKRICQPLIKFRKYRGNALYAIEETLKLAGLDKE